MKRIILPIVFSFIATVSWSQDYVSVGDSCFKTSDFNCAAKNYDLFLEKVEGRSNMIAYRSAKSWSMAGNREKAFAAIRKYVANNYLNGVTNFSNELSGEKSFHSLQNEQEWKEILTVVIQKENEIKMAQKKMVDSLVAYQIILEKQGLLKKIDFRSGNGKALYQRLKKFNNYPKINNRLISMQFRFTDSLHTAYLVVLPKGYDHKHKYPVLFFLHGAVRMNTGYPDYADARDTAGWNRFYTKYAAINKVIMVYPMGNRDYNWMAPDKGFYLIPSILTNIKSIINVDDDKVFISGHSNGATGSFSYAIKQPSPFAGFYGFNTRPQVATGGTFLKNLLSRSFFNVSTDQDYYYPPGANDTLTKVAKSLGIDYQDHRYNGFPHRFPSFNESEEAHKLLFNDLESRKRNPYRPKLEWECDDLKYGKCDWIAITAFDTTAKKERWQRQINFDIKKWVLLDKDNELVIRDTSLKAFKYDKFSAAIKTELKANAFHVSTSGVKRFRIYISPEMVDLKENVRVYVNGKLLFNRIISYDKAFMIKEFSGNLDRSAIWINYIDISIP